MAQTTITLPWMASTMPEQFAQLLAAHPTLQRFAKDRDLSWTIEASDEYDSPEGHFAYGNDDDDRKAVETVRTMQRESVWGWCIVEVSCHYVVGATTIRGDSNYLGACSYHSFDDFMRNSGYALDMMRTAFDSLSSAIVGASSRFLPE